jgi:hypothetical protein
MRIPTWRFLLTGAAITVLAIGGIGLVAAAAAPQPPVANVTAAEATGRPDATRAPGDIRPDRAVARERLERLERAREGWGGGRWLRWGRHLVHAEVTVTGRDGELITLAFDHGTVEAVGGGSFTIAEAGGGTESVSIDDATIVYVGREDGDLDDLTVGDEVFVQSRIDGGTLAKRILIVPATVD